jgi:hypothetical protein
VTCLLLLLLRRQGPGLAPHFLLLSPFALLLLLLLHAAQVVLPQSRPHQVAPEALLLLLPCTLHCAR